MMRQLWDLGLILTLIEGHAQYNRGAKDSGWASVETFLSPSPPPTPRSTHILPVPHISFQACWSPYSQGGGHEAETPLFALLSDDSNFLRNVNLLIRPNS